MDEVISFSVSRAAPRVRPIILGTLWPVMALSEHFFLFLFSLYLLYLFFSCLLPINLVNKVDY